MKTSLRLPLLIAATMTGLLTSCSPENDITPASVATPAVAPQPLPDIDQTTPQPIKKGKPVMETPKQDQLTSGNVRAFLKVAY